ncbi:hypothetical protein Gotur_032580 [Gossypium turneri]
MAEARACLHAVIFTEELGFRECIPRTANETAHALAAKKRQYDAPVYWMEEVPKEWLIFDELSRYGGVRKLRKDRSDERWIPAAPTISLMQERDMENVWRI